MAPLAEAFDVTLALRPDVSQFQRETNEQVEDASEEAAERGGKKFKERFATVAAAAGVAIGAALAAGLAGAISQGNVTGTLAAQLGATGDQAGKLGKIAGSLYANGFGGSFEEVNDALRGVVQNGLVNLDAAQADIERVTGHVTNLAAVLGEDASAVSRAVSQMLRTGMAQSAEEAFDLLAVATQKGLNKSEDLLDTFNEYGTQFRKLGLDGPTSMGLISQAIQAGARDADIAADALKEFSIRAIDGSKLSADAFTALGLDAKKMGTDIAAGGATAAGALDVTLDRLRAIPDPVKRSELAVALFGTQAEDLGDALFAMDATTAVSQLGNLEGAAQRAGDTMAASAGAQVESFKRTLEQGLINAVARVIPYLQDFGSWINRNREWIVPLVAVIGGLAAAVWAVNAATAAWAAVQAAANAVHLIAGLTYVKNTVAVGVWIATQYAARAATAAWTAVQWLLNAALTANPIGIVVVAIAALVAAIVIAYRNSETFRNIVQAVWGAIKTAIGLVVDWFVNTAWPWLKQAWDWIVNAFKVGIDFVIAYFRFWQNIIRAIWDAVVAGFRLGVNLVVGYFTFWRDMLLAVWGFVRDRIFSPISTFITQTIPNAFQNGVAAVGRIWDRVKEMAAAPVRFLIDVVINRGIIDTFNRVSGFFKGPQLSHIGSIGSTSGGGGGGGRAMFADGYGLPPGAGDGLGRGMGDGLGFDDIMRVISGPAAWVAEKVGIGRVASAFGNSPFVQTLTGMATRLKDAAVERIKALIQAGVEFLGGGGTTSGLAPGISTVLGSLRQTFGNVPVISGFRRGSRTLSGAVSYHASGRAIDIAPIFAWALYLSRVWGSRLRELITPWNDLNVHNGRPHRYSGAVWMQHNFAGGNAHIHAALAQGGWVTEPVMGIGASGRTYSIAEHGPELVAPGGVLADLLAEIKALRRDVRAVGGDVGDSLRGNARSALNTARGM